MVGPHTTTSNNNNNVASNHKALAYWMRVAKSGSIDLQELEQTLQRSAYLVPYAATCTLADLDVAVALLLEDTASPSYPPAVQRWMHQICAVLTTLSNETGVDIVPQLPTPPPASMPVFFDGTEDAGALLDALYKPSKQQQGKGGGDGKKQNKKEAKKKEKKADGGAAKQPAAAPVAAAEYDISALDIRVGKITKVWAHESADKLFCEEIDLGNGEVRQIASGLRPFYKEADLQDRLVLVLCNLKKRNLVGFPSHGMVLCASNADHTAVEFVVPPADTKVGERVTFEGIDPDKAPEPENKVAKKKVFEKLAPDLKTNAAGHVVWKTQHVAKTSAGIVQALNGMADAAVS